MPSDNDLPKPSERHVRPVRGHEEAHRRLRQARPGRCRKALNQVDYRIDLSTHSQALCGCSPCPTVANGL